MLVIRLTISKKMKKFSLSISDQLVKFSNGGSKSGGKLGAGSQETKEQSVINVVCNNYDYSIDIKVFDFKSVYSKCVYHPNKFRKSLGFWQKELLYDTRDLNSIRDNRDGVRTREDYLDAVKAITNSKIPNVDGLRYVINHDSAKKFPQDVRQYINKAISLGHCWELGRASLLKNAMFPCCSRDLKIITLIESLLIYHFTGSNL